MNAILQEKPLNIRSLAFANLRRRLFRTIALSSIVGLFTFILFSAFIFYEQMNLGLDNLSKRLGADILIVPYGYDKKTEAALLRGEPSSFYMKADILDKIRQIPGVLQATPQFFLASLMASCCTDKVQIIGFDPESDFLVRPWMHDIITQLNENEVIAGSRILADPGEEIVFFGQKFKVAAKMDATGMGFDTSVFMSLAAIRNLMETGELSNPDYIRPDQSVSSVAIKVHSGEAAKDVANRIMRQLAIEYNLDFIVTKGMVSDIAGRLSLIGYLIFGLAALFWCLASFILLIIFSFSLNERKREMSILRILGTSRSWLARLVLTETLLISLAGALGGWIIASVFIWLFSDLVFFKIGLPNLPVSAGRVFLFSLVTWFAAILSGPVASLYSIFFITRDDVYTTMREGEG